MFQTQVTVGTKAQGKSKYNLCREKRCSKENKPVSGIKKKRPKNQVETTLAWFKDHSKNILFDSNKSLHKALKKAYCCEHYVF